MKLENEMSQIQSYYYNKATEKARLRNVTVNGYPATVIFSEYKAPAELIPDFQKQDGTDGQFYYITACIKNGQTTSYYTGKQVSVAHTMLVDKTEGNRIYKQLKSTNAIDIPELGLN